MTFHSKPAQRFAVAERHEVDRANSLGAWQRAGPLYELVKYRAALFRLVVTRIECEVHRKGRVRPVAGFNGIELRRGPES